MEAKVLFDADKLDAIGAMGVARAIAYAIKAGMPFYAPASLCFQDTGVLEPDEPHSAYHEYLFKLEKIQARIYTPAGRTLAAGRHAFMQSFFEQMQAENLAER